LPIKFRWAAIAAFLLVLLLVVLPFLFSGFASSPNSNQDLTVAQVQSSIAAASNQSYPLASSDNSTKTVQTQVEINLQPNQVGVLETVLIQTVVSPAPPTLNDRFNNLTVFVWCPGGTAEILGPFQSDINGSLSVNYTPEIIGTYSFQGIYGGQFFASANTTYIAVTSSKTTLSVSPDATPNPRVNSQPMKWQVESATTQGLPSLGLISVNSQCLIHNLTGNNRWYLIICPYNGWTENQYPFTGYYWNGFQWINDNTIANGLTAKKGLNNPTVGFNITGQNRFEMIVGGNPYMSSPGWSAYYWNGAIWIPNPTLLNGLPNYANGNNLVTLGYNLLGDGKWDLIVDNAGFQGYLGYEWNGVSWIQKSILVNGLPWEESVGASHKFPAPCLASSFEGRTILFIGLSSGGGPIGSLEAFEWTGTSWVPDQLITYGVSGLLPWPNTPTVALNVTGNNEWVLLIGSTSGFVNQTDYYRSYYWTDRVPVSITPLSSGVNVGLPAVLSAPFLSVHIRGRERKTKFDLSHTLSIQVSGFELAAGVEE
jgi:hypothetical protein